MNEHTDQPNASAALTIVRGLLALMSDAKGAEGRLAELSRLERQAVDSETAVAEKRAAFVKHQALISADLVKLADVVAWRRATIEQVERSVEELTAYVTTTEQDWAGIGLPDQAPRREAVFQLFGPN